ncbi:hypothetical protein CEXT_250261 [Caerostris extrusa]|uniref:Uncharacterized protein n=1 Tax=Caerostris extrusa TaxID=172846 RepID=A0AAV4RMG1_CAEEX|nr:hypothetical protein CEXT_250261 [Caerostris extrusa]
MNDEIFETAIQLDSLVVKLGIPLFKLSVSRDEVRRIDKVNKKSLPLVLSVETDLSPQINLKINSKRKSYEKLKQPGHTEN